MRPPAARHRSVLVVAGETSADRYAARLAEALRARGLDPPLEFFGTGGDAMQAAGVELLCHIRELASIGPREALSHLRKYHQVYRQLTAVCRERRPAVAVLLDFPDFNLRLAKRLKRLGIKVIYYISPQLWAWRRGRIRTVRRFVDRMLVILPFEEEYYRSRGVDAVFVGHPILENFETDADRLAFCHRYSLDADLRTLALLPGSRPKEVAYILPAMLRASRLVSQAIPAQFLISVAPHIDSQEVMRLLNREVGDTSARRRFHILPADARLILANSDFAFVKSGTSTLEAALVGTPYVITYRISPVSWMLGKIMIRSRYKGLVNLIAGEEIVPEYLQAQATPQNLARAALRLLQDESQAGAMRSRLAGIRERLGSRRATEAAAGIVAGYLERREST